MISTPSGSVPFVCRLFPLLPGYTRTKCAAANVHVAAKASIDDMPYIVRDAVYLGAAASVVGGLGSARKGPSSKLWECGGGTKDMAPPLRNSEVTGSSQ
jgi:hypothetical protein